MGNNGGTAFVRINGKRIYLGKFGSSEAKQNYARCIAEWAITTIAEPGQPTPVVGSITIDSLCIGKKGKRYSRQYCNTLTQYIRKMFRWGVAQELVSSVTQSDNKTGDLPRTRELTTFSENTCYFPCFCLRSIHLHWRQIHCRTVRRTCPVRNLLHRNP